MLICVNVHLKLVVVSGIALLGSPGETEEEDQEYEGGDYELGGSVQQF